MKKYFLFIFFKYFYLKWCQFYNYFSIKKLGYRYKIMELVGKKKLREARSGTITPEERIKNLWNNIIPNFKYESDKWYELYDVITNPYIALNRGYGDCDDFASIAIELLGNKIPYTVHTEKYEFWLSGYYSIIFKKSIFDYIRMIFYKEERSTGHTVAVWRRKDMFIVISNKNFHYFKNRNSFINWTKNFDTVDYFVQYDEFFNLLEVEEVNYD